MAVVYKYKVLKKSEMAADLAAELALGFLAVPGGEGVVAVTDKGFQSSLSLNAVGDSEKQYDMVYYDKLPAGAAGLGSVAFLTEVKESAMQAALDAQGAADRELWIRYAEWDKTGERQYDMIFYDFT